jgi:hypothetical protein
MAEDAQCVGALMMKQRPNALVSLPIVQMTWTIGWIRGTVGE